MDGGLVGNVVANDRAGDADGIGLGVVLFAEDVPNFNHVPQLLKEELVGAVKVEVDALELPLVLDGLLDPILIPSLDSGPLAQLHFIE